MYAPSDVTEAFSLPMETALPENTCLNLLSSDRAEGKNLWQNSSVPNPYTISDAFNELYRGGKNC